MGTSFQVLDQAESYTLEANSDSHSSKPSTNSVISPSTSNHPLTSVQSNLESYSSSNLPLVNNLETLHERSNDTALLELDDTFFDTTIGSQITNLDTTSSSNRKRKFVSPDQSGFKFKRKRDSCYSENRKRLSNFFRTPIEYFSHRRRTIGGSLNRSLNDSVLSSSGVFDVQTVQHLNNLNCSELTPCTSNTKPPKIRKNLFKRTFSTSKFSREIKRSLSRRSEQNVSRLSFGDSSECDGQEQNDFPEIVFKTPNCESLLRSLRIKDNGVPPAVNHHVVLTFSIFYICTFVRKF